MLIILSCTEFEFETMLKKVKDNTNEEEDHERWFLSHKELPLDGNGRHQVEVVAEPSQLRNISEWIANDLSTGALEIVEEAIVNNTIGDIDEVNIMEEREHEEKKHDQEEEEEHEEKIGAVREIAEMDIDKDLMASMTGGIQASKKRRKKKKNRKKKQDAWTGSEFKEEVPVQEVTEPIASEEVSGGIQAAPKKKKKKKKKRNNAAYNLGTEPQQRKQKKHEEKEYEFTEVPEEYLKMIHDEEFEYYCSSCPFGTDDMDDYKAHFKSEWHRFNVTRKAKGLFPVMEDQFKEYTILKEFIKK